MAVKNTIDELLAEGTVTVSGAKQEFGIGRSRLYEWMSDGSLPYSQVGARRLIPRVALKRIIAAGMVGGEDAEK